jgi:hypothetical protein
MSSSILKNILSNFYIKSVDENKFPKFGKAGKQHCQFICKKCGYYSEPMHFDHNICLFIPNFVYIQLLDREESSIIFESRMSFDSPRTLFLNLLVNKKLLVFTIHFSNF